ncbi:hypothetical protein SAMN06269250_3380 [Spirosoma fluviale]|uniref:Uncharacterized protein n=1 Tax=Spirosoma fluviale TaxID=1597977 RepID=A0A286G4B0_9BACT|nr:hypothetical protein SAMN06269250_3380 [Spirosoma fluviale]
MGRLEILFSRLNNLLAGTFTNYYLMALPGARKLNVTLRIKPNHKLTG